jgi:outer membrane receptor protein involved in Fe transport
VKPAPPDLWRATNIRDVTSTGFEASLTRTWQRVFFRLYYAGLEVDAPSLDLLSKYVLEYARHQSGGSLSVPVWGGVQAAVTVDHRHRLDGQSYDLVTLHVTRVVRRTELSLDATNLLDAHYHEVTGVEMPGRWVTASVTVR